VDSELHPHLIRSHDLGAEALLEGEGVGWRRGAMKLYIETSVIGFIFATDAPEKMEITQMFFDKEIKKHKSFVSELVLEEIEKTKEESKKNLLKGIIRAYNLKALERTGEAEKLAREYLMAGVASEKHFNDPLHIALAVVHGMDVIVSWNLEHIVKLKTMTIIKKVNKKLGYPDILICTPEEVIE